MSTASSVRSPDGTVRLLLGTESPAYQRPAVEMIAAMLPHADVALLYGQGHMAIDQDPDQFTSAVLAFAN
jgi:pimeloyl-ACP methyl ester carboxylesterase